jgi:hypothetical protein
VLNPDTANDVMKAVTRFNRMRDVGIQRDFHNMLLITIPSSAACMHLIDGVLPVYSENEDPLVPQVGPYSHIDRVLPTGVAPQPAARIFGSEPAHDWCYYYQKASLARQTGDWAEIGRLYDQALTLKLEAGDKSELFPFYEALVNLGRYSDARALFNKEIKGRPRVRFPLCASLSKDPGYPASFGYDYQKIYEIMCNS